MYVHFKIGVCGEELVYLSGTVPAKIFKMFIKVEGDPNQIVIEDRYWMLGQLDF